MTEYDTPTKSDIDRMLSLIGLDARHDAEAEIDRLIALFASRGLLNSGGLISAMIKALDAKHRTAMNRARDALHDLAARMPDTPSQIAAIARPHLCNLGSSIVVLALRAGHGDEGQRVVAQYRVVFDQRVDHTLRDFEIGFARSREQPPSASAASTPKDLVEIKPEIWGVKLDLVEAWRRLRRWWSAGN